ALPICYADTDDAFDAPVQSMRFRPLFTVTADDEVEEALAQMQKVGIHVARVIDAQAQVLGLLFLEDVLQELVGEVQDAMQRGRCDFRRRATPAVAPCPYRWYPVGAGGTRSGTTASDGLGGPTTATDNICNG